MIPNDWKWYRRLRGGRWAPVMGYLWGRRWVAAGDGYELFGEYEEWGRAGWRAPIDWLNEKWLPVYCRFAWFHLMRAESDGHFIIVYQRKNVPDSGPRVDGYRIDSSSWTPSGCQRAAQGSVFWDKLMDALGDKGRKQLVSDLKSFKPGPQPPSTGATR